MELKVDLQVMGTQHKTPILFCGKLFSLHLVITNFGVDSFYLPEVPKSETWQKCQTITVWTWRLTAKKSFMSIGLALKLVVMQLSQSECGSSKSPPQRLCNLSSLQFYIFQLLAWFGNKSQHSHTLWEYCHSLFLHLLRTPTPPLRTGSHQQCTTLHDHFWAKYT